MDELDVAKLAAQEAGKLLLDFQGRNHLPYKVKESHYSLVTAADLASERKIIEIIKDYYPKHGILSEERSRKISGDWIWVVDPLDGTSGFRRGFANYSVAIALLYQNQPVVGVVYQPILNQLFTAQKNKGAFLNGEAIATSQISEINRAVVTLSHSDLRFFNKQENFSKLYFDANLIRLLNSCALELAYLASAQNDLLIQVNQPIWDIAAGSLIVEESGGKILNFKGESIIFKASCDFQEHIIATNSKFDIEWLKNYLV
jgi:myo-inositol-1(or 4)-monophosphatase